MIHSLRIPDERKAVLIGHSGTTRRKIEKKTRTKITVGDEVTIEGESVDVMTCENIVKAIGRGFSPENALELADEECTLEIIELSKNENELKRVRSRLIGTRGKARRNLELLTRTKISIYGRTVSIIGKYEDVERAETAINNLMKGFSHKAVYEQLEKKQKEIKQDNTGKIER